MERKDHHKNLSQHSILPFSDTHNFILILFTNEIISGNMSSKILKRCYLFLLFLPDAIVFTESTDHGMLIAKGVHKSS